MKHRSNKLRLAGAWCQGSHVLGVLILVAVVFCAMTVQFAWPGITPAASADTTTGQATVTAITDEGGEPGSGLPGGPLPGATSSPESVVGPSGWEVSALRDLAEVRDWPPFVNRDPNGRLIVQQGESSTESALALIRPFEYRPGASAAFAAEQEDARLSGFRVSTDVYYSYPAYWAVIYDIDGTPLEMRFHWLANTWIMGVEVQRDGVRTADVRAIAEQLLALSIQYGLPAPPSGNQPTATVLTTRTAAPTRSPVPCNVSFDDVSTGHWAYSFIMELGCSGIVSGYADGSFRPQNSTTRAQLTKMLVLAEEWPTVVPSQPTFEDVGIGHTFYRFIETAHARGIISGYSDGTFRPDDFVSRAQVAKMIVKGRGWPLRISSPVTLCDVGEDHWAYGFIQVAIERGIFTGYGDGCFQPDAPATRAQLAKVLTLAHR